MKHRCKKCGHTWKGRKARTGGLPKQCPYCHSTIWHKGMRKDRSETAQVTYPEPITIDYEDATNTGGSEWYGCMWFDDQSDVPEGCAERGYNVGHLEVPLQTVDVTWRVGTRGFTTEHTRPAAHPSERGCYTTMPLVLCTPHTMQIAKRSVQYKVEENEQAKHA